MVGLCRLLMFGALLPLTPISCVAFPLRHLEGTPHERF
jgi:hypothetical protein